MNEDYIEAISGIGYCTFLLGRATREQVTISILMSFIHSTIIICIMGNENVIHLLFPLDVIQNERRQLFLEAKKYFNQAEAMKPSCNTTYNLACLCSLLNQPDECRGSILIPSLFPSFFVFFSLSLCLSVFFFKLFSLFSVLIFDLLYPNYRLMDDVDRVA
jgi:hypothetical protein